MTLLRNFWRVVLGQQSQEVELPRTPAAEQPHQVVLPTFEIAPDDPIIAYFQNTSGVIDIKKLELDSPALQALKQVGVKIVIPLVSQGELMGLINLGPRLSSQEYSADDRQLLDNLAAQAAPAVRVAQLVRQQQVEALARERIEQELRVARLIQHSLLPKDVPALPGWQVAACYQPAREVGGDFYDFLFFPDGRLGLVVGDVTDKGVPAALVMATTRTLIRAIAQRLISPGEVLERVNDLLLPDIPPRMFVTCLYAVLDLTTGRLQYANAGHDPPYRRTNGSVTELRATGMPLGLLPGMSYEEKETTLAPGESILLYSDGLVEAHNPQRAMFGFPRLQQLVAASPHASGTPLIDFLMAELAGFTGAGWEQEDDVTLVTLERTPMPAGGPHYHPESSVEREKALSPQTDKEVEAEDNWQTLAEFAFPSEPGNERLISEQVASVVTALNLPSRRLEQLKTAVAEATMNAMEHGNQYRPELPVSIRVLVSKTALAVQISDQGGSQPILAHETPDLKAKLAGLQMPRGWGLFLIEKMVDEMHVTSDENRHIIELILHLKGEEHARKSP